MMKVEKPAQIHQIWDPFLKREADILEIYLLEVMN
jgi:hypothetical protein